MNRRCGRKGIVIARRTVTGLVEPQEVVVRARHLVLRGRPRRRDELPELRERDLIAPVLVRLEPQAIEDRALVRVRGVVPSHVVAVQAVPELLIRQVSVPVRVEREEEVAKGARPYVTMLAGDDVLQVVSSRDGKRILRINVRVPRHEIDGWSERTRVQTLVAFAGDPMVADTEEGSKRWARWELRELVKDEAVHPVR